MRVLTVTIYQNLGFPAAAVCLCLLSLGHYRSSICSNITENMTLRGRVFPLPLLEDEELLEGMGSGSRLALGRWHLAEADLPPLSICDSTQQLLSFKA